MMSIIMKQLREVLVGRLHLGGRAWTVNQVE